MKCIICNKETISSEEHIIPEALGNKDFITSDVCKECNSKLGEKIDYHLTNCFHFKLCRKKYNLLGKKNKSIHLFPSKLKDTNNITYLVKNDIPEIIPNLKIDNDSNIIQITASNEDSAKTALKNYLKKRKFKPEQIKKYLNTMHFEKKSVKLVSFEYTEEIHKNFLLAIIKIAYEIACKFFGDKYNNDDIAKFIQKMLYNEIYNKATTFNNIMTVLPILKKNMYTSIFENTSFPLMHLCVLHTTEDNMLICDLVFFKEYYYSVLLSKNAKLYIENNKNYIVMILANKTHIVV